MADTKGYVKGDWNAYCDYCGGQYLASQLDTDYWGFKACKLDFTLPNPQMFVRPKTEQIVVPWSRPRDGTEAYQVTTTTNIGFAGSVFLAVPPVEAGTLIYEYLTALGGACQVKLRAPNTAVLNIPYQISITHLAVDSTGVASTGTITLSGFSCRFVGNALLNPGEVAVIVMNKVGNSWTRIN